MKKQEQTVEVATLTFLQKLHRAKQSIKKVAKNAKNPHFKNNYADINALIDEVEPVLLENNLLLLQPIEDGYVFSRIIDIDSGEIADQDFSTLAIALYGNQTKSMDDGIYTIYDSSNNIYKQYNLYEIRDQFNNLLYEVRQDRGNNIDFSKNFTNITQ